MAPRLNISVRKPVGIDTKIRYQEPPSIGCGTLKHKERKGKFNENYTYKDLNGEKVCVLECLNPYRR